MVNLIFGIHPSTYYAAEIASLFLQSTSLERALLCLIAFVILLSSCIINTISIFEQHAMAQSKTIGPQGQNQTGQIISNKILEVRLLADSLGNKLNKTANFTSYKQIATSKECVIF